MYSCMNMYSYIYLYMSIHMYMYVYAFCMEIIQVGPATEAFYLWYIHNP
jgi:hypothetical protein